MQEEQFLCSLQLLCKLSTGADANLTVFFDICLIETLRKTSMFNVGNYKLKMTEVFSIGGQNIENVFSRDWENQRSPNVLSLFSESMQT